VAYLRLTLLQPRPGVEDELKHLLQELDASLAGAPGLLLSFVLSQRNGGLGRVSLWLSKDDANREAASEHVLSLRSRLRYLSLEKEDNLLEVESGHFPAGFSKLIDGAKEPFFIPAAATQPALPG
jgi:hypothetical protein